MKVMILTDLEIAPHLLSCQWQLIICKKGLSPEFWYISSSN